MSVHRKGNEHTQRPQPQRPGFVPPASAPHPHQNPAPPPHPQMPHHPPGKPMPQMPSQGCC